MYLNFKTKQSVSRPKAFTLITNLPNSSRRLDQGLRSGGPYFNLFEKNFSKSQKGLFLQTKETKSALHPPMADTCSPFKLYNFTFDKGRLKSLVSWSLKNYGEHKTIKLLENLKKTGFEYATKAGISLGIEDLKIPPKKALLLFEAEEISKKAIDQYNRSEITGVERFQRLIDTWHRTSEQLKQEVIDFFESTDILNPVYMMAFSGARGNISQVRQLVGMRGLMADAKGQILDYPIRSNFKEGLTLTEYIISSYGARKGIVDTALRTANAGYLTRRLVDVAQHVVVASYDCKTSQGIFLTDMKEGNKTIYSLQTRLLGRVLARDIYIDKNTKKEIASIKKAVSIKPYLYSTNSSRNLEFKNKADTLPSDKDSLFLLASKNQEISADLAHEICKYSKKVFVRSPLTCETKKRVCQLCYGWSLAQGILVSIGEAVGIVAAQSIGEPGTQLTMRTFHTGGVFSGDVSDQIRAPYNGFVQYPEKMAGTLIRTPEGKIAFLTKIDGFIVVNNYKENNTLSADTSKISKKFKIPAYTILFYKSGDPVIEKQVIAQISTIARQQNMRDDSELTVKSQIQGQFFVKTLQVQEKILGPKTKKDGKVNPLLLQKTLASWDWGYAWILSCKLNKIPILSHTEKLKIVPKFGDFVNKKSILTQVQWFLPPNGGLATFFENTYIAPSAYKSASSQKKPLLVGSFFNKRNLSKKGLEALDRFVCTPNQVFKNLNINKNLLFLDITKIAYKKIGYFLDNPEFVIFIPNNIKGGFEKSPYQKVSLGLGQKFFGIQVFPKNFCPPEADSFQKWAHVELEKKSENNKLILEKNNGPTVYTNKSSYDCLFKKSSHHFGKKQKKVSTETRLKPPALTRKKNGNKLSDSARSRSLIKNQALIGAWPTFYWAKELHSKKALSATVVLAAKKAWPGKKEPAKLFKGLGQSKISMGLIKHFSKKVRPEASNKKNAVGGFFEIASLKSTTLGKPSPFSGLASTKKLPVKSESLTMNSYHRQGLGTASKVSTYSFKKGYKRKAFFSNKLSAIHVYSLDGSISNKTESVKGLMTKKEAWLTFSKDTYGPVAHTLSGVPYTSAEPINQKLFITFRVIPSKQLFFVEKENYGHSFFQNALTLKREAYLPEVDTLNSRPISFLSKLESSVIYPSLTEKDKKTSPLTVQPGGSGKSGAKTIPTFYLLRSFNRKKWSFKGLWPLKKVKSGSTATQEPKASGLNTKKVYLELTAKEFFKPKSTKLSSTGLNSQDVGFYTLSAKYSDLKPKTDGALTRNFAYFISSLYSIENMFWYAEKLKLKKRGQVRGAWNSFTTKASSKAVGLRKNTYPLFYNSSSRLELKKNAVFGLLKKGFSDTKTKISLLDQEAISLKAFAPYLVKKMGLNNKDLHNIGQAPKRVWPTFNFCLIQGFGGAGLTKKPTTWFINNKPRFLPPCLAGAIGFANKNITKKQKSPQAKADGLSLFSSKFFIEKSQALLDAWSELYTGFYSIRKARHYPPLADRSKVKSLNLVNKYLSKKSKAGGFKASLSKTIKRIPLFNKTSTVQKLNSSKQVIIGKILFLSAQPIVKRYHDSGLNVKNLFYLYSYLPETDKPKAYNNGAEVTNKNIFPRVEIVFKPNFFFCYKVAKNIDLSKESKQATTALMSCGKNKNRNPSLISKYKPKLYPPEAAVGFTKQSSKNLSIASRIYNKQIISLNPLSKKPNAHLFILLKSSGLIYGQSPCIDKTSNLSFKSEKTFNGLIQRPKASSLKIDSKMVGQAYTSFLLTYSVPYFFKKKSYSASELKKKWRGPIAHYFKNVKVILNNHAGSINNIVSNLSPQAFKAGGLKAQGSTLNSSLLREFKNGADTNLNLENTSKAAWSYNTATHFLHQFLSNLLINYSSFNTHPTISFADSSCSNQITPKALKVKKIKAQKMLLKEKLLRENAPFFVNKKMCFSIKTILLGFLNQVCFEFNLLINYKNYKHGYLSKTYHKLRPGVLKGAGIGGTYQTDKTTSPSRMDYSTMQTKLKVYFDNIQFALTSLAKTSFFSSHEGESLLGSPPLEKNSVPQRGVTKLSVEGVRAVGTYYLQKVGHAPNEAWQKKSPTKVNRLKGSGLIKKPKTSGLKKVVPSNIQNFHNPISFLKKQNIQKNQNRSIILTKKDILSYKIENSFETNRKFFNKSHRHLTKTYVGDGHCFIKVQKYLSTTFSNLSTPPSIVNLPFDTNRIVNQEQSDTWQAKAFHLDRPRTVRNLAYQVGSFILRGDIALKSIPSKVFSNKTSVTGTLFKSSGLYHDKANGLKPFADNMKSQTSIESRHKRVFTLPGQIIHLSQKKVTIRKAQPLFISAKATFHSFQGDFVQTNEPVITLIYQKLKTGDIIQGIPKVEQFFEARTTKRGRLFRDNLPNLLKGLFLKYYFYSYQLFKQGFKTNTKKSQALLATLPKALKVKSSLSPAKDSASYSQASKGAWPTNLDYAYLALQWAVKQSFYKIQQIAVDGVLRVYRAQGVTISDKHLEIVVKQMTTKVRVIQGGQTGFFPGELVDLDFVETINTVLVGGAGKKVHYEPVILGITKSSLHVDSFLSSASFQQTSRILTQSALFNKKDFLKGIKENVILGNLIPAGTGYLVF